MARDGAPDSTDPGIRPGHAATLGRVRGKRILPVVFYGGLALVLVSILVQWLGRIAPDPVAARVGHNSEGYLAALAVAGWIQYARPRLAGHRREWAGTAAVAAACLAIGLALLASDLPSRWRTLNETFLALALLVPYLQLRRPLPRALAGGIAAGLLAVVVAFESTAAVTDLAEAFGLLILAPVAFDLVDRGILDPGARTSTRTRWLWYGALVAVPVALSVLEYQIGVDGVPGVAVRYGVRVTEAFGCLLLVELYLAVFLGRTGRRDRAAEPAAAAGRAAGRAG
jgi:hypothetical protein